MVKIPFPEPEYSARKQQPGRNDPCPCGSGKKYKQCCMNKENQLSSAESLWRRLRETDDKLMAPLLKYFSEIMPDDDMILEAWEEFTVYRPNQDFDLYHPEIQAFLPWMIFNWEPEIWEEDEAEDDDIEEDPGYRSTSDALSETAEGGAGTDAGDINDDLEEDGLGELIATGPPVAERFLMERSRRLSEMERRFIEINLKTYFSFYEILDCQPGKGFTLKDLLLGREIFVYERTLSSQVSAGNILFARVVVYDEVAILVGCGSVPIPPIHKLRIIDLRAALQRDSVVDRLADIHLLEWEEDIRDLYQAIYHAMHTPPQMHNTDGDPILWHDLYFKISTTTAAAFQALSTLALDTTEEELLIDAEYDDDGHLTYIEIPWLRKGYKGTPAGDYTTLGHITIERNELSVSVNSEKRAKKIRKEIEKRLGKQVAFLEMNVKTVEAMMEDAPDEPAGDISPEDYTPEMNAAIDQMMARHWETWPDEKIPALGNITPRQAAKTKIGREKLAAILDDMEFRERKNPLPGMSQLKYILKIREELGV